jgi:hypothetical protein
MREAEQNHKITPYHNAKKYVVNFLLHNGPNVQQMNFRLGLESDCVTASVQLMSHSGSTVTITVTGIIFNLNLNFLNVQLPVFTGRRQP